MWHTDPFEQRSNCSHAPVQQSRLHAVQSPVKKLTGAVVLALSCGLYTGTAVGAAPSSAAQWAEGYILVQPKAGLSEEKLQQLLERNGGRVIDKLQHKLEQLNIKKVRVPPRAEQAVAQALRRSPHIAFAEVDALVTPEMVPNDSYYPNAWHLPMIQAPSAWDYSQGHGVVVAVLDTGVDANHSDLGGQLLPGWNTSSNNSDTSDIFGHGTKVAGTLGAASNNGEGVASVAWNVSLLPVRITDRSDGAAYTSDIAEGITWAADHGADIANISYDNMNAYSTIISAAQYMRSKGGVVVVAAGNSGINPGYAERPELITVSATGSNDSRTSWSNYGNFVDLTAPGEGIWTTTNGGGYGSVSGTSFSCPVVAGVAALIKAANPALTPDEVEAVLENGADDLGTGGWDVYYGHGRVNAAAAVQLAQQAPVVDSLTPAVAIVTPGMNSTVAGWVEVQVDASDNVGVQAVSLYADGQLVGTDSVAPYQFSWDSTSAAEGEVVLNAIATDGAGNEGGSGAYPVVVDNQAEPIDLVAPTVTIQNPVDGSTVSGKVAILVSAQDDVALQAIELYIDGSLKASVTSGSLAYNWNTRKVADGVHTFIARATDKAGNQTARSIQVNVGVDTSSTSKGKGNR